MAGVLAGMLLLDIHKVAIAIPALERSLDPGPTGIQLVHAAYVVTFALTLIPSGQLGDRGNRLVLIGVGLTLYLAASALCTFAPAIEWVILGRAILGVAAGILMPQAMGLVQSLFSGTERGRAFGVYGVCVSLTTSIGPSLGGLLIWFGGEEHGWRGVFFLNLPIGIALSIAALVLLPPLRAELLPDGGRTNQSDFLGLTLVGGAIVMFLAPFILTTGRPSDPSWRWLLLILSIAFGIGAALRSRARGRAGLGTAIDFQLLSLRSLRNGVLISLTWFAAGPAFTLGLLVYLQATLGLNAFVAGLLMLPSAVSSAAGAALGGRFVNRHGRRVTILGMCISAVGMILSALSLNLPLAGVLIAIPALQLLTGFGGGLVVSPNHAQTLADVPRDKGGAASSLGQLAQRMSNSAGVALASVALFVPIYGAGLTLDTAPAGLALSATHATMLVALGFMAVALTIAFTDRRRQRSAGRTEQ